MFWEIKNFVDTFRDFQYLDFFILQKRNSNTLIIWLFIELNDTHLIYVDKKMSIQYIDIEKEMIWDHFFHYSFMECWEAYMDLKEEFLWTLKSNKETVESCIKDVVNKYSNLFKKN